MCKASWIKTWNFCFFLWISWKLLLSSKACVALLFLTHCTTLQKVKVISSTTRIAPTSHFESKSPPLNLLQHWLVNVWLPAEPVIDEPFNKVKKKSNQERLALYPSSLLWVFDHVLQVQIIWLLHCSHCHCDVNEFGLQHLISMSKTRSETHRWLWLREHYLSHQTHRAPLQALIKSGVHSFSHRELVFNTSLNHSF